MDQPDELWHHLHGETAQIRWQELQKHYASGMVLFVTESLDLIDVACAVAQDNKAKVQTWLQAQQVGSVTDDMARQWLAQDPVLWAVVVSPFVLVQQRSD